LSKMINAFGIKKIKTTLTSLHFQKSSPLIDDWSVY
jgi:hypothetical protein